MATRIFELARELGVKSKDVLEKLRAEGVDIKNHMSAVSAGLEATIREWFSTDGGTHTAVEQTEHVDIEKARRRAEKDRRRSKKQKEDEAVAKAKAEAEAEARAAEEASKEAEETAAEQAPAEAPAATAVAEAPPAEQAPGAETPAEPAAAAAAEASESEPQAESEATEVEEPEEEAEPDEEDKDVAPAGPQVVPKPAALKGPRVVRVEKPDYAPRPQSRQQPMQPPPGLRSPGMRNLKDQRKSADDTTAKKRAKRSPRRKGGRSGLAESGEKLKEWRDRDLLERSDRLAAAAGGLRRRRATLGRGGGKHRGGSGGVKTGTVEIDEPITVKSLSAETGLKSAMIIRQLMNKGHMATLNQVISTELAEQVCLEFDIDLAVRKAKTAEEAMLETFESREKGEQISRAPVVTFLGHVDHGKTSLLDRLRETRVAAGEAGGITQAMGAYRYDQGDKHVVFLDTPGHEAFTAMRSRGANMTDVVVLVVAADDGVMPQTIEAINHAKAAGVPIVVALNKIDLPNANPNKALGQLAEHDLQPQEWGGDTEVVRTSAETGDGIDELLELLSLESEMLELKAEPDAPGQGYVVEARMDPGKGVLATLLNVNGHVKVGDVLLAGRGFGRVRQIYTDTGDTVQQVGPATPVAITGLDEVPEAGDRFFGLPDLDEARAVAEERRREDRRESLQKVGSAGPKTLEDLLGQIDKGERHELPIIIKADVQGSIEALVGSLEKLGSDEARLNILHTTVGGITTGDVTLAEASGAVIIGFNVVADPSARRLADEKGIEIRLYRVIYNIIDDLKRALEEGLAPEVREETLGQAEVRQLFKISRLGTIAGCYVSEGVAQRNAKVRIIRNNVVVEDERELDSLKRVKDDTREVKAGLECGLKIKGYDDIKEGDVIEFYKEVEVARTL
ncbi:MAG: translation initiation factor IF-2 [Planctomycetes bacterium]|nr:translation initiation factor IF-2 [Planctomycetota bacterium]